MVTTISILSMDADWDRFIDENESSGKFLLRMGSNTYSTHIQDIFVVHQSRGMTSQWDDINKGFHTVWWETKIGKRGRTKRKEK